MAARAAILVLAFALSASADDIAWSEPDEAWCAKLRAESLSWGIPADAADESLRSDPGCQLSDTALRSHFPKVGSGPRLDECQHFTRPRSSTIRYTPQRTSDNVVSTREVHCTHYVEERRSECEFESTKGYFVEDANKYFEASGPLPEAKALAIARALPSSLTALFGESGNYRQRVDRMSLRRVSARGEHIEIQLANCGCEATVLVELRSQDQLARVGDPKLVCT